MTVALPGKRVLVVEDNPALAYDIDDALRECGAEVVGPALDLSTGLRLAYQRDLDGAVLDIDICGEYVWPLARVLKDNEVPLVFVSAECVDDLPEDFRDFACLAKPAASATVLAKVSDALARA